MTATLAQQRQMMVLRLPAAPWCDRSGAVSPLKALAFAALLSPALVQAYALILGPRLAQPIADTIHAFGDWAVYLLMASLAITPLRQTLAWARLIVVRRMIGVAAFAYALAHVTAFAASKNFDLPRVVSEIVLRTYLTIGATALVLLAVLAATSTDGMVRRLGGKRWQWLHRGAYFAAAIAVTHYFLQSKADLARPMLVAGLAGWMLLYRLMLWVFGSTVASRPISVAAISIIAAAGTALSESLYLAFKFGAPVPAVIAMQFGLEPPGPRPAFWVLAAGLALALAASVRQDGPVRRLVANRLVRAG